MQLPPMCSPRSMTATRFPKYAAWAPPFSPAGPQPITIRSKASLEFTSSSVEYSHICQRSASRRIVGEEHISVRKFLVEVCWIAPSERTLPLTLGNRGETDLSTPPPFLRKNAESIEKMGLSFLLNARKCKRV